MEPLILYFEVHTQVDVSDDGIRPIYDDTGKHLLGGFVLKRDSTIACFVSRQARPYSLFFTSGMPFYLTLQYIENTTDLASACISEYAISDSSYKVTHFDYVYGEANEN